MNKNSIIINAINKRIVAGLLSVSLMTGLTGCSEVSYGIPMETTDKDKIVYTSVGYDEIRNWRIVVFEFNEKKSVYLIEKIIISGRAGSTIRYYNVFGGQLLYASNNKSAELKIIEEMYLGDYLIINNKIQSTYTEQELKDILEEIKTEYEPEKDKQLVKE